MKISYSIKYLIFLVLLVNAVGLFVPALRSTFTPYYGSIAKHIITSGNWSNLVLLNQDWLDKPHLPFWLSAVFYKIFGINSFAYILPGFLFHLLGLYFTYKLAKLLYNKKVALLAVLFTATVLHLMLSAIDVRAEAYMLGEIMPAVYFWLCYDQAGKLKYLSGGVFFTALALMTKGPFVLITIVSGFAIKWIYQDRWQNFISLKWLFALLLSIILVFPELIALYKQFDLHPEKIIYGHNHVSGIRWFFWDSQFGRFLSTGPIRNDHADFTHYFFFMHTFLWAYLPWWPVFFVAIIEFVKKVVRKQQDLENEVFLFASFFVTFILFSISVFQVDHYTNIIFPFASIICAKWCYDQISCVDGRCHKFVFYLENIITLVLLLAVLVLAPYVLDGVSRAVVLVLDIVALGLIVRLRNQQWQLKIIIFPTLAISIIFLFVTLVNATQYIKYDGGYQLAHYLNHKNNIRVYSYAIDQKNQIDMLELNLHSHNEYIQINDSNQLKQIKAEASYLVIEPENLAEIKQYFPNVVIEKDFRALTIEEFLANILDPNKLNKQAYTYLLLKVSD